jgi:SAM-dependent methyltransferase
MPEPQERTEEASARFRYTAAQAEHYDRYRPSYPANVFITLMREADLVEGDVAIEIGAGTGLATRPLVESGLTVHAVEPAVELTKVAKEKLEGRAAFINGRFEDCSLPQPARLIAAFNAWHWVDPTIALDRAADLLEPEGSLALVWTEVLSWGPPQFEFRLAELSGVPWPKVVPQVEESLKPVRADARYGDLRVFHHPFERTLDSESYIAVTQTYGGHRSSEEYRALERLIRQEFNNAIVKREDAVCYISRRL